MCNRSDVVPISTGSTYDHYKIYLDDETVSDITTVGGSGVPATAAITAILKELGIIAKVGSIFGYALVALLAVKNGELQLKNDGCGVVIDMYVVNNYASPHPYIGDLPVHTISSQ